MSGQNAAYRIGFVDYAKGICIVMVVMMHSTLGVEEAAGSLSQLMHGLVEFARPFRMPDFFLIAGLFLARTINRDWRTYLDRKAVHFIYFYALWVSIQFTLRAPGIMAEDGVSGLISAYLLAYVEPFGTLWFIYLLPLFFVLTKVLRNAPVMLVTLAAAALHMMQIHTGWTVIDEFANRYVFFFMGYAFAPLVFSFAGAVESKRALALAGLALWVAVNAFFVTQGLSKIPGITFVLGLAGAFAVVTVSALLASLNLGRLLRYCGENSIVIYLAFSPFMAATRVALLKTGIVANVDLIALMVTVAAIAGPLMLHLVVRSTPARLLFVRPDWARLGTAPRPAVLSPA